MGGTGAAANGSAPAMEKPQIDAGIASRGGQPDLSLSQVPMTRENATILVAIAVADHDLQQRPRPVFPLLEITQRSHGNRVCQEIGKDAATVLQILDRLRSEEHTSELQSLR